MDLNRFNGTCAQFNAKYGTHIVPIGTNPEPPQPPQPPQPPGQLPPYVIINTGALAIHSTPKAIDLNKIGSCLQGTKWYPLELVHTDIDWYRIAKDAYISKGYVRYP